jgi:uncharacterized repeat protein (TIGR03843 family)
MTAERVEGQDAVAVHLPEDEALPILQDGEVIGGQQIPWSSNYTFLLRLDAGPGRFLRAVYKPKAGERPLYDFPGGTLYKREYAAYLLGRAIGWPPVPLTLIREGPYGVGSMQLYVESDPRITYFDLVSDHSDEFSRFTAFDLVANNADRKGGHCVLGADGTIWSIDHGLTFHPEFKVRTVMLEFWGAPLEEALLPDLRTLAERLNSPGGLRAELCDLLSSEEVDALLHRTEAVLEDPVFPRLDPRRNVPWPLE